MWINDLHDFLFRGYALRRRNWREGRRIFLDSSEIINVIHRNDTYEPYVVDMSDLAFGDWEVSQTGVPFSIIMDSFESCGENIRRHSWPEYEYLYKYIDKYGKLRAAKFCLGKVLDKNYEFTAEDKIADDWGVFFYDGVSKEAYRVDESMKNLNKGEIAR